MTFKALKELILTISRNKVKQLELFGDGSDRRIDQFYDGIVDGEFNSEEDIATYFFKDGDIKSSDYRKLKSRLIRQLINTSFFIDVNQPMFKERSKAFYNCHRDFSAAYILNTRAAPNAAKQILENTLEHCIKFEFVELAAEITRHLRSLHSRSISDKVLHTKYSKLHILYEEKRRLEILSLNYVEDLFSYYMGKRSPNDKIKERSEKYYDDLKSQMDGTPNTAFFLYNMYNIGMIKCHASSDYQGAYDLCEETLKTLGTNENLNGGALINIFLQKLSLIVQLRLPNTLENDAVFEQTMALEEDGHGNWYRAIELYLYYHLYTKRYAAALAIFKKAVTHSMYEFLHDTYKENWVLIGQYLHFLAAVGRLDKDEVLDAAGTLRYDQIWSEVDILDKDKEAMNIPLLILPMLFAAAKKEYQNFGRSPEAIEQYRKRWLSNDLNKRSNSFLKMLVALSERKYDEAGADRLIAKQMAILKGQTPQLAAQNFAVEIIPYEDLWEILME